MFNEIRFNKRREDFKALRDYNDYLETVEDLSEFCQDVILGPNIFVRIVRQVGPQSWLTISYNCCVRK